MKQICEHHLRQPDQTDSMQCDECNRCIGCGNIYYNEIEEESQDDSCPYCENTSIENHTTKYLRFELREKKTKTNVYRIISKKHNYALGTIKWYGAWRQYCFFPDDGFATIWNKDCLKDIIDFLEKQKNQRKNLEVKSGDDANDSIPPKDKSLGILPTIL